MGNYQTLSKDALEKELATLRESYADYQAQNLKLDMSRGKPAPAQLDLSMPMLETLLPGVNMKDENGNDTRNYGVLEGIPEARQLFAEILEVPAQQVIVGGGSSLNLMYDAVTRALLLGVYGGSKPWGKQGNIKFLCPVPGYDRHFAICEQLGIQMINIKTGPEGPDMDEIQRLVSSDAAIKGIWCVPKYGNPNGIVYSEAVVRQFAALKPAADDFRILWDNAYVIHDLYPENTPKLLNIFEACREAGSEDMVFVFSSTSKISFSGSGISCIAASKNNINFIKNQLIVQTIGYDKVNQLRHARFYKDKATIMAHMHKLAEIIRPKFEAVLEVLESELGALGVAEWTKPLGGYFISLDALPGCAKRTVTLCKEAGVVLTGAGATYPYGKDPEDRNIRIAPTFPSPEELALAAKLLCLSVKIASCEKLLEA